MTRPATGTSPGLTDVHAHLVTEHYVERARAALGSRPDGMPAWPSWTAADHLALMDDTGVQRAVLSVSSPGVHFGDDAAARELAAHVDDAAAAACAAHPDRFSFFTALPLPDVDGALGQVRRGLDELGAVGVAVESNAGGRYLGDPLFEPLWAELDSREAVVFIHPTSPPGWEAVAIGNPRPMVEFLFDTTRSVLSLLQAGTLQRHRRVRVVVPHCGAALPVLADRIALFLDTVLPGQDDPAADGAASPAVSGAQAREVLSRLWYDLTGAPMPHQGPAIAALVGDEHLLYGSDYCFTAPAGVRAQVQGLDDDWSARTAGLADPDWRALTTRNAGHLLGGLPSAPVRAQDR